MLVCNVLDCITRVNRRSITNQKYMAIYETEESKVKEVLPGFPGGFIHIDSMAAEFWKNLRLTEKIKL